MTTADWRDDCLEALEFPKQIKNRPGLSHLAYRIGTYADFREALLRNLDRDEILKNWTHREAEDPGIALLEGASILGDILTFYQELYANEAYLRTAQWRESIGDLVRLVGYLLSPGVGGQGMFAFGVKGEKPVVIPKGFPIKAQLEGFQQQAEFQSIAEVTAYPHLSKFHLYRPRLVSQPIDIGSTSLEIESVNNLTDVKSIEAVALKKGDRLMLIPDTTLIDGSQTTGKPPQQVAEIAIISKVDKVLDRTVIELEGSITQKWDTSVKAYRLGRSFHHFGHNAPPLTTRLSGTPPQASQFATNFYRKIYGKHTPAPNNSNFYSELAETTLPLDAEVDDLATGNKIICQGFLVPFWRPFAELMIDWTQVSLLWNTLQKFQSQLKAASTSSNQSISPTQNFFGKYIATKQLSHGLIEPLMSAMEETIATKQMEIISSKKEQNQMVTPNLIDSLPSQAGLIYEEGFIGRNKPLLKWVETVSFLVRKFIPWLKDLLELSISLPVPFTVVREIKRVGVDGFKWGNLSGSATVITTNHRLIINQIIALFWQFCDLRQMQFHEVKSPELTLRGLSQWENGSFADTDTTLNFFGTYDQALALIGRSLILQKDEIVQQVKITSSSRNFSLTDRDRINPWLWSVTLDRKPELFLKEDFDEQNPQVSAYGNLVEANQGKTEKEALLGNGDSRQVFQTFKLPKSPLTYHNSKSETPPEVPELEIYVNDSLWKRVPSFFNRGAKEEIYIVREDSNGDSWVQFGDGQTGARLPSGVKNVVAKYRTGIGAHGAIKQGTNIQGGQLNRLDKIWLPGVVSGGDQPETGDKAKQVAPSKTQSLGRLVSLKDFESETLAIPGVAKASAAWQLQQNTPSVVLTVLMEMGRELEFKTIQTLLNEYNRCRGSRRFPVIVNQGKLQYIYLSLTVGTNPTLRQKPIETAIKTALGITGDEGNGIDGSQGLFGIRQRQFGQKEYASRIEGIIQNVEDVVWVKVTALGFIQGNSDNPLKLTLPDEPKPLNPTLFCQGDRILSLHKTHLQLNTTAIVAKEVC